MILFVGNQALLLVVVLRQLVLIPVCLAYLDEAVYGAWLAVSGAVAFLAVADFGINSLLVQRTARQFGSRDWNALGKTIASGLGAIGLIATGVFLATLAIAPWVPGWLGVRQATAEFAWAIRLAALDVVLLLMDMSMGGVLFGLQRPTAHMLSLIVGQALGLVATVGLLASGLGLLALPVGSLCGTAMVFAVNAISLWLVIRAVLPAGATRFDASTLRSLLTTSSMLFLMRLARTFVMRSFGVLVAVVLSAPLVVVIEVMRRASLMVVDALGRLSQSLLPGLSHLGGTGERETARRVAVLQLRLTAGLGILGLGLVLALNRDFVRLWAGDRYDGGRLLNGLLCLYAMLQLLGIATYHVILAAERVRAVTWAAVVEAAVQVGLSLPLGMLWGLEGMVLAGVIAATLSLTIHAASLLDVLSLSVSQPGVWRAAARYALIAAMFGLAGIRVEGLWPVDGWLELLVLALVYAAAGSGLLLLCDASLRQIALCGLARKSVLSVPQPAASGHDAAGADARPLVLGVPQTDPSDSVTVM